MKLIDMHCDTISVLHGNKERKSLFNNECQVDIQKLKKADSKAQFFALFLEMEEVKKSGREPYEFVNSMLNRFYEEIEENKDYIRIARNFQEMEQNCNEGKISAFLTIEEGGALEGSIENLEEVHNKGVRLVTLTWNYPNELGFPNCKKEMMNKGLTNRGIEFVERMNELNMLVDVSHLSDGGFYDVVKHSKVPFVASHSNARAISNHCRNLTDEMIKELSNKGGVMGLNFATEFLNEHDSISKISHMVEHLKHIKNVGGIDVMAMGTDFDGIDSKLEIEDIGHMDKLVFGLESAGFTELEIEKIYNKNAERVIKEVLR